MRHVGMWVFFGPSMWLPLSTEIFPGGRFWETPRWVIPNYFPPTISPNEATSHGPEEGVQDQCCQVEGGRRAARKPLQGLCTTGKPARPAVHHRRALIARSSMGTMGG